MDALSIFMPFSLMNWIEDTMHRTCSLQTCFSLNFFTPCCSKTNDPTSLCVSKFFCLDAASDFCFGLCLSHEGISISLLQLYQFFLYNSNRSLGDTYFTHTLHALSFLCLHLFINLSICVNVHDNVIQFMIFNKFVWCFS